MAATYEPIATTTVSGSSTASVTFNSFSGYTDLIIIGQYGWQADDKYLSLVLNSDTTASNYSSTVLVGSGSPGSANSYRFTGSNGLYDLVGTGGTSGSLGSTAIINIMNYANSTTYKTFLTRAGDTNAATTASVGLWRNTAAITSLTLKDNNGSNFYDGSKFTVYGILAA